jgi:hydrogenase maturation protease
VIGVGSELRGDDAFGPAAVHALAEGGAIRGVEGVGDVEVFDGGVAPENLAERVARPGPKTVLVIDAAELGDEGGVTGELKLVDPSELGWRDAGTHAPSLELLASYLRRRCGAETLLLAARPGRTELGAEMSAEMRDAARRAASLVREALAGPKK